MTASRRKRILLVTRNLPPLVGGMERLNWHMAEELSKVAEVRVIGPAGSAALAPEGVEVREAPLAPLWKFLLRARARARREAKAWKPDLVLAGSGLTAPLARSAARACGAKTVVYVHGLDVALRNLVYRVLWLPAIRRADRVIANSHATAELCRGVGVDPARLGIVHPGVDLPPDLEPLSSREAGKGEGPEPRAAAGSGQPGGNATAEAIPLNLPLQAKGGAPTPPSAGRGSREARGDAAFRAHHGLGDRPLLLSVGRLSARKGLREFVTQALPRIVAVRPDVMLWIVGDAPSQALHAEAQTPASIRAAAEAEGVGDHVRFLGKLPEAELLDAYQAADVHVFPIRHIPGDPEGFGMVAVEAAAHGLPTVAFATGGVVDAVAEGLSGHLVEPGDCAAFADAVISALDKRNALGVSCVDFARRFAWSEFGSQIARQLGIS